MPPYKYKIDYAESCCAKKYGNKGLMLYALALQYDIDDIDSLASDSLTDNTDDKGIDVLHIIPEKRTAIIVQGYMAQDDTKPSAKASKAAEFNTAISWALSQPLTEVPKTIRMNVSDLRDAIQGDEVRQIQFWYVHNLNESSNVKNELNVVEATAKSLLTTFFGGKDVLVSSLEVGNETLEKWYQTKTQTIMVDDILETDVKYGGYAVNANHWQAFHTTVALAWLKEIYAKYQNDLFSANIRGYLGSVEINNGIKDTCTTHPDNFWIYNNGITCLVHKFEYDESKKKIKLTGISIINGAQTTGAVGSVTVGGDGYLPIRFVTSDKADVWHDMILFNNSQNKIYSFDFKSNDEVQKRLREEFKSIPNTEYAGRRGETEEIVRRKPNLISTEKAAIALVAFHGDPTLTYHRKQEIWNDQNYPLYYNTDLTAKHLVFTYSLLVAIENKKDELRKNDNLTKLEAEEYEFLQKRGGMRLLLSAIGQSLEEILSRPVPNAKRLSFGNVSWKDGCDLWKDVVDKTIMFCSKLRPGIENGILKPEYVKSSIKDFSAAVASQIASNKTMFDDFKQKVH